MTLNNTMLDFVSANFLIQMTDKPTSNDTTLDLNLTTNLDLIEDLDTHPGLSDHCAVTYRVNVTVKRHKKPDPYVFQYRKGDLDGIKRDMGEFGAKFLSEDPFKRSVNNNWDLYKENLVNSMKKNIPQNKVSSRWNLPWMTPEIKRLCRKKKRA